MNSSISNSNTDAGAKPARRFLAAFAATAPALLTALAVLAYFNYERVPAPRISENVSFNEKALWLSRRLVSGSATDVLVVGSSMALNNINGPTIERDLGVRSVLNAGSWGLPMDATCTMFVELLRHVRPRLIVLAVYHGDLRAGQPMEIQWPDFAQSLKAGQEGALYFNNPDVWYYFKSYRDQSRERKLGRASYTSLDFDATGGVPLDCLNFHRSEARWDHFKSETFPATDISQPALADVGKMARMARDRQIPFWVVVCPMRPEAERVLATETRAALWRSVRAQVEAAGGVFIAAPSELPLTDDDFVDYIHLNACGAEKFTAAWLRAGRSRSPGPFP